MASLRNKEEIQRFLRDLCGQPVDLFAYPNGKANIDYTDWHVEMLKSLGFKAAVSTEWGTATRSSDLYQLPRFSEDLDFILLRPVDTFDWQPYLKKLFEKNIEIAC